mmetsp:Transcript_387/g.1151  ORF Transcript_387/g.1151 Transcript_387/m.1151 type:complete len:200 (-) Transcript_387:374-973(-)
MTCASPFDLWCGWARSPRRSSCSPRARGSAGPASPSHSATRCCRPPARRVSPAGHSPRSSTREELTLAGAPPVEAHHPHKCLPPGRRTRGLATVEGRGRGGWSCGGPPGRPTALAVVAAVCWRHAHAHAPGRRGRSAAAWRGCGWFAPGAARMMIQVCVGVGVGVASAAPGGSAAMGLTSTEGWTMTQPMSPWWQWSCW